MTDANEPQGIVVRRSQRERKSTIPNDYMVYLQESDFDIGINEDLVSYSQAINNVKFDKLIDAMKDGLKSMEQNSFCDLVELPKNYKRVRCKWVFKTKHDSKDNIERYEAKLIAKCYT